MPGGNKTLHVLIQTCNWHRSGVLGKSLTVSAYIPVTNV